MISRFHFNLFVFTFGTFIYGVTSYNFSKETCMDDIGKITAELLIPTSLSQPVEVYPEDLEYLLFTTYYPVEEIPINETTKYLINTKLETKVLISGWLDGYNVGWIFQLRNIYLRRQPYNVIIFKWDEYAFMHYIFSTELCLELGKNLGDFLVSLVEEIGLDLDKVHLIGHSLGAHIAGSTGQQVLTRLRRKIGRITGLDPAGPIFNFNTESYRLDKNDAKFVDVIHTNSLLFGYKGVLGTVDVFVNNAVFQPGCPSANDIMRTNLTCEDIHLFLFCSHAKSIEVWKQSIDKELVAVNVFTGHHLVIGENINTRSSGFYYLQIIF